MATKAKTSIEFIGVGGKPMTLTKAVQQADAREIRKADAAARLAYHQDRQAEAKRLRAAYGYLGDDEAVFAMHWLAVAFQAVPSLAKWAASKTVRGRKPSPVELKQITFDWLHQPVCDASRRRVYQALTGGVQ